MSNVIPFPHLDERLIEIRRAQQEGNRLRYWQLVGANFWDSYTEAKRRRIALGLQTISAAEAKALEAAQHAHARIREEVMS